MSKMHMKLLDPEFLSRGTERQKKAHSAIGALGIFEKLAVFRPVLAGAIPLGVDTATSGLDVILDAENLEALAEKIETLYGDEKNFTLAHQLVRNQPTLLVRFESSGFPIEFFAQNR